jgi:hypothetical protein
VGRLTTLRHPARLLDELGLRGVADLLRRVRWGTTFVAQMAHPRAVVHLLQLWLREPLGRRRYRFLSEPELLRTRRSDTVFVFGSGRSLVDISDEDWRRIAEHDTVSFSHFHRQRWVRMDYYLVAELASARETVDSIRANPCFADTILGLMTGWMAEKSNEMIVDALLPTGTRMFRWKRVARGRSGAPSRRLADGLVHGVGTIQDAVNFALVMGWRRIVIAGVDLYNREYFWLPPGTVVPNERPGVLASSRWEHADFVVDALASWAETAARDGITLEVFDSRSLLAEKLPLFHW